jgi:leucyl aminopeptidase (aminopeptidase T)/transposase-like protein
VRVAPAVLLSPEERATLLRWSRGRRPKHSRAIRALIVLGAAGGAQDLEISRRLGIGRLTVARWRKRFLVARLRGIEGPSARLPRAGGIASTRVREIVQASVLGRYFGPQRSSTRALARRFGVSHTTVRRLWLEFGVRPAGRQASPVRPDPIPPFELRDVIALFLHPPDLAVAFSLGPGLGTQTGSVAAPASAMPPTDSLAPWGKLPVRPIGDWSAPSPPSNSRRTAGLLRFLGALGSAAGRARPVKVVLTTSVGGPVPDLTEWQLRRPNVRMEFCASPEEWNRRVSSELKRMKHRVIHRKGAHGPSETTRSIAQFLAAATARSESFTWVASSPEIEAGDAGIRLRYDLSVTGDTGFKTPVEISPTMRTRPPPDTRAREMARVVLRKSLRVRPGEHVAIESWSETLEYANAFVLESLRLGAFPLLLYQDEPTYWAAVAESRPSHLSRVGTHLKAAISKSDALVTFFGPSDRERFHALPASTMNRLSEYRDSLYAAAARGGTRAVQIAIGRASPASARMYGVDLAAWKSELVDSTTVDPEKLHTRAARVARALRRGRVLEITHPNHTRLRLGLRGRRPQVSDGRVPPARPGGDWNLVQLPAGVVSVALDERVAEGTFHSNVRNSVGVFDTVGEVDGGQWTFSNGHLDRFSYDVGQDVFSESYARGPQGKDTVGLLSVGLNDRISMSPLLLDQEAGSLTLQLGRNEGAGGSNRFYWWAWLILRGADLRVDGTSIVRRGRIVE